MIVRPPTVGPPELKRELMEEAHEWRARAREFAHELVRPVGQVLDRMDSQAAVAPGSPVFDFMAQAQREGFTRLTDSHELGGLGLSRVSEYLVLEELATADAGLAAALIAAPLPFRWARAVGGQQLIDDLARPYFSLERTDWSGCCAAGGPTSRLRATRSGDGWVIGGSTSPWVTAAATATHAVLACAVDDGVRYTHGLAVIPLDRDGVARGAPLDLLGLRTQSRARLALQGVRLSSDELLLSPRPQLNLVGAARAMAHVATAIVAVGIGRAAYEGTLRLAREHEEDGRALVEHPDVRRRLLRMFTLLDAARSLTRAVHLYTASRVDAREGCSIQHAAAAHAFATEGALEIVDTAMSLCRGRGDEGGRVQYLDGSTFHPEKLLRDAQTYKVSRPAGATPAPLAAVHH
jgi:alkylation response protein AidB-like acyl-CoA dehydrogenase